MQEPWHGHWNGRGLDTLVNQGGKVDTKAKSIDSWFLNWIYRYISNNFLDMLLNRYTDRYVAGDSMCGVGCCRVPTNLWTDM